MNQTGRDHGGGLDSAIAQYGGQRSEWMDLSTGINPIPFPVSPIPNDAWTALPDQGAMSALLSAARAFWNVPDGADIVAASGASALISQIPHLFSKGRVRIDRPTYNEHAAAFDAAGWDETGSNPNARVVVHPNNPDGSLWDGTGRAEIMIVDESFCDIAPSQSHISKSKDANTLVLKSFGKFWGLAGARLGFAMGPPELISDLRNRLGPWAVSGPAIHVGTEALRDSLWATETRTHLAKQAQQLDNLMQRANALPLGGTPLFRLYDTGNAHLWQAHLAQHKIWSRVFPYSKTWLRLGIPHLDQEHRLATALGMAGGATLPKATSGAGQTE